MVREKIKSLHTNDMQALRLLAAIRRNYATA